MTPPTIHPAIPWHTLKKAEKIERLADTVDHLDVVISKLAAQVDRMDRQRNWHNEQGDKELAIALKRIRKLENRIERGGQVAARI